MTGGSHRRPCWFNRIDRRSWNQLRPYFPTCKYWQLDESHNFRVLRVIKRSGKDRHGGESLRSFKMTSFAGARAPEWSGERETARGSIDLTLSTWNDGLVRCQIKVSVPPHVTHCERPVTFMRGKSDGENDGLSESTTKERGEGVLQWINRFLIFKRNVSIGVNMRRRRLPRVPGAAEQWGHKSSEARIASSANIDFLVQCMTVIQCLVPDQTSATCSTKQ